MAIVIPEVFAGPDGTIYQAIPDYAKRETTNRITANGGQWAATKPGYVTVSIGGKGATATTIVTAAIYVNNIVVSSLQTYQQITLLDTLEVNAGNTVRALLSVSSGAISSLAVSCYYTPFATI